MVLDKKTCTSDILANIQYTKYVFDLLPIVTKKRKKILMPVVRKLLNHSYITMKIRSRSGQSIKMAMHSNLSNIVYMMNEMRSWSGKH